MVVWETIAAIVARRRPVPLILYAIGAIVAAAIAAFLLVSKVVVTSTLLVASLAVGFIAAIVGVIIWQLSHAAESSGGGGGVAVRVIRGLVVRGVAFSVLVFLISLIVRAVHHPA
jgi:hypothetical protein